MRPLCLLLLSASVPSVASATGPTDLVPSAMSTHDGEALATPPADAYRDLVENLGAAIANQGSLPAYTTGTTGWEVSLGSTALFTKAYDDTPTAWQLAHPDGQPPRELWIPTVTMRKGLPLSLELGATGGWHAGSHQGLVGGFLRFAPVEGHKPFPDVSLQAGYSTYLGNDELSLDVFDVQGTLGSTFDIQRLLGITFSKFSPFLNASLLVVRSGSSLDEATQASIGATEFGGKEADQPALILPRIGAGFQITTSAVLLRLSASWAPSTAPALTMGFGLKL